MSLIKHKNKTKAIIVKTGEYTVEKFTHADESVEEIRVQEEIDFGMYIPAKTHLQMYLDLPNGSSLEHLELSDVMICTKEKTKDFPKGVPTGLFRAHMSKSYVAPAKPKK